MNGDLDELLTCRLDKKRKQVEPVTLVIFGASGDLTRRKLIPALYHLYLEGQLPEPFRIIGFSRREKTDEIWRQELWQSLQKFSRTQPVELSSWERFAGCISYQRGDITQDNDSVVTQALTALDGTTYATVDAAIAAGVASVDITSDNRVVIEAALSLALTDPNGDLYVSIEEILDSILHKNLKWPYITQCFYSQCRVFLLITTGVLYWRSIW